MPLDSLTLRIADSLPFQEIVAAIQSGTQLPNLGLPRAARLPVLVALRRALNVPILLLTGRTNFTLTLADELNLWAAEVPQLFFPEPNPLFYENAPWGVTTRRDRLLVLTRLAASQIPGSQSLISNLSRSIPDRGQSPIIIAPARAVMSRTLPRRDFIKTTRSIKPGYGSTARSRQSTQPGELARNWVSLGYEPVNTVIAPGQFARRGGILDIWPPADPHPTRIEFFGDEIETLRHFNPATQRSIAAHERILITPAREFIVKLSSRPSVSPKTLNVSNGDEISEFHIPLIHPSPTGILDYLPRNALVIIEHSDAFRDTIQELEEQAIALRKDYIEAEIIPEDFPIPYLTWDQIQDSLSIKPTLELGPVTADDELQDKAPPLAGRFSPNPRFGGQVKPLLEHLAQTAASGDQAVIVSRQVTRLKELWQEQYSPLETVRSLRPPATPTLGGRLTPPELGAGGHGPLLQSQLAPVFVKGSLTDGWTFTADEAPNIHLLTDGEIFGWQRPRPRQRHRPVAEAPEAAYANLKTRDWVVHVDHGVGRFAGLVRRSIENIEHEYLCLEYADGDQLFVPIHQADRVTRYVGPSSRAPNLTRLGGTQWITVKNRVKKAVEDMAEDLLELYANRSVIQGYAFGPDSSWQQELEASFPYIETVDQVSVLAEVKRDMETPRPMDRLICGDVGYGKTEVALRAAFKAVMDGKQVAILTPTTVLAQQHYHTFRDRLTAFPVVVEMLSRFRSPQQQQNIISRLGQGRIDIVIGTHRLFSGDVDFKDLGLLIIDEEQRFGVTHKEALKQLRTEVDVLTMTATPIPRTLYMTLTGVRDISTISTPPEERLPIITHVGPYSPRLVRRAILRELERGGQIFFVHNRVQTIRAIYSHLSKLVPEARIGIAHGQMPEAELSKRMQEFTAAEIDILLSTSIIESGLDIPNANTLIVDRADTFGLAQLYQLRGRVGRGAQRAYAYFFKHRRKSPTPEGLQRLETLAENTQLGAGFTIAMRDLEIRGAGDILGTRQHGHIAAVGFHLYTRLLAEAVKRKRDARGLPMDKSSLTFSAHRPLVMVDLPLRANIPTDYVPNQDMRLGLYRRMAEVQTPDEIEALEAEFSDRFGMPPPAVQNLLYQMKVKILAAAAGLSSVSTENGQLVLRYPQYVTPPPRPDLSPQVRAGKTAYWVRLPAEFETWSVLVLDILKALGDAVIS